MGSFSFVVLRDYYLICNGDQTLSCCDSNFNFKIDSDLQAAIAFYRIVDAKFFHWAAAIFRTLDKFE